MKIKLSQSATIEIEDNGKVIKTFNVTFREPTRKELKKLGKDDKEIIEVFSKSKSLTDRASVLESKIQALSKMGTNSDKLFKATEKLEKIYDDQDELEEKFEKLGGIDKLFEASKRTFEKFVSGKDKEALAIFTEESSEYSTVLDAIKKDISDNQGK